MSLFREPAPARPVALQRITLALALFVIVEFLCFFIVIPRRPSADDRFEKDSTIRRPLCKCRWPNLALPMDL